MEQAAALHRKAAELGKLVVRMTAAAGSGHPSSALSLAHLTTYLMYCKMRYDPQDPWNPAADRLVLSEGHAVPIVYAAYAALNGAVGRDNSGTFLLQPDDVLTLREHTGVLDGHPNPAEGFPFFDAATGSLGQGLSVAAGLALAARLDGTPRRVYVLIGDGESREGQVWEALDFIVDHGLRNVCPIFNANGHGQAAPVSPQQSANRLLAKLRAFGWAATVIDGHDPVAIHKAFSRVGRTRRPLAIIARTVKGWGVPALQQGNWHGKPLRPEQVAQAEQALDQVAGGTDIQLGRPPAPAPRPAICRPEPRSVTWPAFEEAVQSAGLGTALASGRLATRQGYAIAIKTAGDLLPQVVVLDGDVSNSTFTEIFARAHPERFFEARIAEQNMVSVAVGLSAAGYIPFVNSFGKFLLRACDQIDMASISRANIKLVGSHVGVTPAADGPSQMALTDLAYFRSFSGVPGDDRASPLCWIYHPADAVAAFHCTRLMVEHRGMCYMRTHRPAVPLIYPPQTAFRPGGFHVLASGADLAIVAAGYMVHVGKQVIELLARQNLHATLIDAYSLPLDADELVAVLERAGNQAIVIEDNYAGGLGAAVTEIAAARGNLLVYPLHCRRIPRSARTEALALAWCGLSPQQIADHVLAWLRRPGTFPPAMAGTARRRG